ncbi:WXG100 family type VII secretion target [Frankia sp. Cpl3]|nr:WXG100 family type VII secretion target [Frankia sp. Cpl3]
MVDYTFNPNGALDTAAELKMVTDKIDTSLATLMTQVQNFITANAGSAPDNYAAAQQLWNSGQKKMQESLALGQAKLQEIHATYVLGDNQGAAVFGTI